MAAPQVAAVGAMMRALNPFASLREILRTLKQTAQRPPGTAWTDDLGWGILDAGRRSTPFAGSTTSRRSRGCGYRGYPGEPPSGCAGADTTRALQA
jgi:hypothetical protein